MVTESLFDPRETYYSQVLLQDIRFVHESMLMIFMNLG
jgi:hypothetical protein